MIFVDDFHYEKQGRNYVNGIILGIRSYCCPDSPSNVDIYIEGRCSINRELAWPWCAQQLEYLTFISEWCLVPKQPLRDPKGV